MSIIVALTFLTLTPTTMSAAESNNDINELTDEGIYFVTDTDEKSEYLLDLDGDTLRYIETQKELKNGIQEIHTKVYNDNTDELLQDSITKIDGTKIIDQEINKFESLPEKESNKNQLFSAQATSNIVSNKSLVTYLGISYKTNHNTNKGYASYAGLNTKTVSLNGGSASNRNNYNEFTQAVDSMRGHENGTIVGWLITAFSGGGLTVGTILSWKTAKVILKNVAGPVAFATNAYALSMWVYHYNKVSNSYYAIN